MLDAPQYTLKQLAYLVAVEDAGTITEAAKRVHISPSALSDALTDLEKLIGTQLCVRRRAHGVTLTAAGRLVTQRARGLLSGAAELSHSLSSTAGELAGPITIACYPTLAPTVLPPLLHDFGTQHPRVHMEFLETTHDELDGRIESGEVDVAFVYETFVPGNSRRSRLFELPPHVLLPDDDPLAQLPTVRLEDVVDRDLILLDAPPSSAHTLSLFATRGLTPRIRHRTASYEAVRTLVGRGLGYGVLVQRRQTRPRMRAIPWQ